VSQKVLVVLFAMIFACVFAACDSGSDVSTGGYEYTNPNTPFPLAGTTWRGVHTLSMQISFTSASAYTRTEGSGSIYGTYSASGTSITLTDQTGGGRTYTGSVYYNGDPAPTMTISNLGVFSKI